MSTKDGIVVCIRQNGVLEFELSPRRSREKKAEIVNAVEKLAKFLGLELLPGGDDGGGSTSVSRAIVNRPRTGS